MSYIDSHLSSSSVPDSSSAPSAARRLRTRTSDISGFLRRSSSHREVPPAVPAPDAADPTKKRRIPLFGLKRRSGGVFKDTSASASESESSNKRDWRRNKRYSSGPSSSAGPSPTTPSPPVPPLTFAPSSVPTHASSLPFTSALSRFSPPSLSRSPSRANASTRSTTPTAPRKSTTSSHHRDRHGRGHDRETDTSDITPTNDAFPRNSSNQQHLGQTSRDSDRERDTPTPTASTSASNSAPHSASTSASSSSPMTSRSSSSAFFIPLPPSSTAKLQQKEREQKEEQQQRPLITISPAPSPTRAQLIEVENMYAFPRVAPPVPTPTEHQPSSSTTRFPSQTARRSSVERVRPDVPSVSAPASSVTSTPPRSSRIHFPSSSTSRGGSSVPSQSPRSDGEYSTGGSSLSSRVRRPTLQTRRLGAAVPATHGRTPSQSTSATGSSYGVDSSVDYERAMEFRARIEASASESERGNEKGRRRLGFGTGMTSAGKTSSKATPATPTPVPTSKERESAPSPAPPQRTVRKPMPTPAQQIRERAVENFEKQAAVSGGAQSHPRSGSGNSAELEAVPDLASTIDRPSSADKPKREKTSDERKEKDRPLISSMRKLSGSMSTSDSSAPPSSKPRLVSSKRSSQLSNAHSPSNLSPDVSPSSTPVPYSRDRTASGINSPALSVKPRGSLSPPESPVTSSRTPSPSGKSKLRPPVSPTTTTPTSGSSKLRPSMSSKTLATSSTPGPTPQPAPPDPRHAAPPAAYRSSRTISMTSGSGSSLSAQTLVSIPSTTISTSSSRQSASVSASASSASSRTLFTPSSSSFSGGLDSAHLESIAGLPTIPSLASLTQPRDYETEKKAMSRPPVPTHPVPPPPVPALTHAHSSSKISTAAGADVAPDLAAALTRNRELEAENAALLARIDVLERAARRRDREIRGLRYLVANGHVAGWDAALEGMEDGEVPFPSLVSAPGPTGTVRGRLHRSHTIPGPVVGVPPVPATARSREESEVSLSVDTLHSVLESVAAEETPAERERRRRREREERREEERRARRGSRSRPSVSMSAAVPRASGEVSAQAQAQAKYAQNLQWARAPSIEQVMVGNTEKAAERREPGRERDGMEEMLKRLKAFAGKAERGR